MTFDQAIEQLTAEFGAADTTQTTTETREICSGGAPVRVDDEDQTPALCASREVAIALWLASVQEVMRRGIKPASWWIADGPHLDLFHITIMDSRKMHRTAADRYSVTAKIGFTVPAAQDKD